MLIVDVTFGETVHIGHDIELTPTKRRSEIAFAIKAKGYLPIYRAEIHPEGIHNVQTDEQCIIDPPPDDESN